MANPDASVGLVPVRRIDGAPYMANLMACNVPVGDGTRIGIGDPVKLAGDAGSVTGQDDFPTVAICAAGDRIFGVMIGKMPQKWDTTVHRAASTEEDILVLPVNGMVFQIEEDSVGGALAATNLGQNADIVITANCDVDSGLSKVELDSSTASAATAQLRILRIAPIMRNGEKNAVGVNAVYEVMVNEMELADSFAGV